MESTAHWRAISKTCEAIQAQLGQRAASHDKSHANVKAPRLSLRESITPLLAQIIENDHPELAQEISQSWYPNLVQNLETEATEIQQNFAKAWSSLAGNGKARISGEEALTQLHTLHFEREVKYRMSLVSRTLQTSRRHDHYPEEEAGEVSVLWSKSRHILMEQVYQRHPRLQTHEKKLLSEASGLSIRQISVWFANQRQRRGWPVQEEAETPAAAPATSSTPVSTSSRSQLGVLGARSVSPISPTISSTGSSVAGDSSACPSLSSSVSSRSSSGAWTSSPTRAHFGDIDGVRVQEASSLSSSTSSTLSNPAPAPLFDIDHLFKQLSNTKQQAQQQIGALPQPSQQWSHVSVPTFDAARNDIFTTPAVASSHSWIAPQQTVFQDVKPHITKEMTISPLQTPATVIQPPTLSTFDFNVSQWMPVAKPASPPAFTTASSSILPPGDNAASAFSFSFTAPTPKADQPAFAPLQLDTSMYFGAADSFLGMKPNTSLASTDTGADAFLSTSCKASPEVSDAPSVADVAVPAVVAKAGDEPSQTCFWDDFKHLLAEDVPDPHTVFLKSTENWEELFKQDFSVWSDPNNAPISAES